MAIIPHFKVTTEWQEIIGVSEVPQNFTIQNTGLSDILVMFGDTPNDSDAIYFTSVYNPLGNIPTSFVVDGTENTEKIWVKSIGDRGSKISINRN